MKGKVHVGVSGWRYKGWRGTFYPKGLAQKEELAFLSRAFSTVEINGTFYSLQKPERFRSWKASTPEGFVFAVKGSRYITHILRLQNIESALANFFASGVLALEEKLGPLLWQLPPNFKFDKKRLSAFLNRLPKTGKKAIELARQRDSRVSRRSYIPKTFRRRIQHVIEVRHPSFDTPDFFNLLKRKNIGLVFSDSPKRWPYFETVTSQVVYLRLHGHSELYASGYSRSYLKKLSVKLKQWMDKGLNAYVFFDNDAKVRAPGDAKTLMRLLHRKEAPVGHSRTIV